MKAVAATAATDDVDLNETQAARLLGVPAGTMRQWRLRDKTRPPGQVAKAPPHRMEGRSPRYPLSQLRAWIRALPTDMGVPVFPDNKVRAHAEHYHQAA